MTKKILIINGPNLNLLSKRNQDIYGGSSLEDLKNQCFSVAKDLNLYLDFKQSNFEGDIINWIQQSEYDGYNAIIINPAAYTHTSIAIMDAILDCNLVVIEVHLSNIYSRESFRNFSYISKATQGVISGFGVYSYILALYAVAKK